MGKLFTWERLFVLLLILTIFLLRFYQYYPLQSFSSDSYFTIRQAEHIAQYGTPIFNDTLSYSGRLYIFPPLFYYITALFSLIFEMSLALKILMSLCFAGIVLMVYLISKFISKSKEVSFICALFSGFVPVLYFNPTQINSVVFTTFLTLLLSYCFLRIDEPNFASLSIIVSVLLLFTSPIIFLFLAACLIYFIIQFSEKQKPSNKEFELVVFLFFLAVWFYVLLYKKALFLHGFGIFENNTPVEILTAYFQEITFASILYSLGFVPLILGIYGVYISVFDVKSKSTNFFIAFSVISFFSLWLKIIPFRSGLIFLSICLIIICSHALKVIFTRMSNMKAEKTAKFVTAIIITLFVLTSIAPFLQKKDIAPQSIDDVNALLWLSKNTFQNATVLSRVDEGFLVNHFAQRKNVADNNFLFIKDADDIYVDVKSMYSSRLTSEAVRLLNTYSVDYIYLSKSTQDILGEEGLVYVQDNDCFELVYSSSSKIYLFNDCRI